MPLSKRLLDMVVSFCALVVLSPVIAVVLFLVWSVDGRFPLYMPERVGHRGRVFRLYKVRTMIVDADKTQMDTTATDDPRIIRFGHFFRRTKIDELPQFLNVLLGDLSLVGPRPAALRSAALYTIEEHCISLAVPGITDISSIVFSTLDDLMAGTADPNLAYHQLVRPWKSRFALFYIDNRSFVFDLELLWLTAIALVSKSRARKGVARALDRRGGDRQLVEIASGRSPLVPCPPPGADEVVTSLEKAYGNFGR